MSKKYVAEIYDVLFKRQESAKNMLYSKEPETHEQGFYQGMAWAYERALDEVIRLDMTINDELTEEEAIQIIEEGI